MTILHVVGARPNFMKAAPVVRELAARGITNLLVHTGQHYDPSMSDSFLADLDMPAPDVHLGVGSGSHAAQTAGVMERLEPVLLEDRPELVVVFGDVNSTLASALVCAKLLIPVAHIESGLRSFDRTMPEEVNRVLTDQVAELLFTTSPEAEGNLIREGVDRDRIHFVGNTMIDSLERGLHRAGESKIVEQIGLDGARYGLVTLHRPSNVDDPDTLRGILEALRDVAASTPLIFPAHPRTTKMLREHGLDGLLRRDPSPAEGLIGIEPLSYLDFLALQSRASVVITDSGGIQEETTILGVPCLTVRPNTERPITIELGTNRLVGTDPEVIRREALAALEAGPRAAGRPPLWDGKAGERVAAVVAGWLPERGSTT